MTSIGLTSSSARLLHSWVLHVILASFVCGTTYAPLPKSAALTSPIAILHRLRRLGAHFHPHGRSDTDQVVSSRSRSLPLKG
jgi:hypothetical protein